MVNEQTSICENVVVWDGNADTWTPPAGYLMFIQASTPAKVWKWNKSALAWELVIVVGQGGIGFTWDGTYLVTDEPMPEAQPSVDGAQTL